MSNNINELDEQDIGLKAIMGDRFDDGAQQGSKPVKTCRAKAVCMDVPDEDKIPADLRKNGMDFADKLMAFCKKSLVFAVVSWACFFWEAKGLMDASIAVPAMWLCAVSAGFGAGRLVCEGRK